MKNALILHAWYSKPKDIWYPWLKKELEKKDYQVFLPELPTMNTNLPDMKKMLRCIDTSKYINKETIVIGHSLSCALAMRLAEKNKFSKMFLIAGWDYDDLFAPHKLFWPNKINHKKIKINVKKIFCVTSDNDPYTTAFQTNEMNKRLNGKFILIKNAGHFGEKDKCNKIPQLLDFL